MLIHTTLKRLWAQHQSFLPFFIIKTNKEQANETAPGLYDPLYYNKQKRNKQKHAITPRIPKLLL